MTSASISGQFPVFIYRRIFNPFLANVLILYTLKTPENPWFSVVFRGIRWKHLQKMGYMTLTADINFHHKLHLRTLVVSLNAYQRHVQHFTLTFFGLSFYSCFKKLHRTGSYLWLVPIKTIRKLIMLVTQESIRCSHAYHFSCVKAQCIAMNTIRSFFCHVEVAITVEI